MFVQQLWRYPVKSMRGERCDALDLEARGVVSDRAFAIHAPNGQLGSGKASRRFRRIDGLIEFQATLSASIPEIRFPDGRQCVRADDPAIHATLSAVLDQSVALQREDRVSHFDSAPVHLLTTASLAWLGKALPDAALDPQRFRPNLVIDAGGQHPVEQEWLGRSLRIGRQVVLRISKRCDRCRMVSFEQGGLVSDDRILRHIVEHAGGSFGMYAEVLVPGRVEAGDCVVLVEHGSHASPPPDVACASCVPALGTVPAL